MKQNLNFDDIKGIDMNTVIKGIAEELAKRAYIDAELLSTEEIDVVTDEVYGLYWDNPKFFDVRCDLEEKILKRAVLMEQNGFIYGFKCAVGMLCDYAENKKVPATDQSTQGTINI